MSIDNLLGYLKVNVHRGVNLAIRDLRSSDPYVIIKMGEQKLKTRVVKKNLNPVWDEDFTLSVVESLPVKLAVYDRDLLLADDKMGDAEFDFTPILEAATKCYNKPPNNTIITTVKPGRTNCLVEDSYIMWTDGGVVQNMVLRLRNVEHGELEINLRWIDVLGRRELLGLLKVHVNRGVDLAIRDLRSSDPYVIIRMGNQKLKTRVVKKNLNPVWDEELTLLIEDALPVSVEVYDWDLLSADDRMGDAEFDFRPFLDAVRGDFKDLQDNIIIKTVEPTRDNCLVEESKIKWVDGGVVQNMVLRLRNVECGEIEISLRWVDVPRE